MDRYEVYHFLPCRVLRRSRENQGVFRSVLGRRYSYSTVQLSHWLSPSGIPFWAFCSVRDAFYISLTKFCVLWHNVFCLIKEFRVSGTERGYSVWLPFSRDQRRICIIVLMRTILITWVYWFSVTRIGNACCPWMLFVVKNPSASPSSLCVILGHAKFTTLLTKRYPTETSTTNTVTLEQQL